MKQVKESIKTILGKGLSVEDGLFSLYHANGAMGYQEGDPTPYVISSCDDDFYEEYSNIDKAVESFLILTGISEL